MYSEKTVPPQLVQWVIDNHVFKIHEKAKPVFEKAKEVFGVEPYVLTTFRKKHNLSLILSAICEYLYEKEYFTIIEIHRATGKSRKAINAYRAKMWNAPRQEYIDVRDRLFKAMEDA